MPPRPSCVISTDGGLLLYVHWLWTRACCLPAPAGLLLQCIKASPITAVRQTHPSWGTGGLCPGIKKLHGRWMTAVYPTNPFVFGARELVDAGRGNCRLGGISSFVLMLVGGAPTCQVHPAVNIRASIWSTSATSHCSGSHCLLPPFSERGTLQPKVNQLFSKMLLARH